MKKCASLDPLSIFKNQPQEEEKHDVAKRVHQTICASVLDDNV
jgi:hypothetical protein